MLSDETYSYNFPAIRGVQAGREYYVSMCPLELVVKLIKFNEEGEPPEISAQRFLNKSRIPAIASYIVDNTDSYAFSSLTVSVDSRVKFSAYEESGNGRKLGTITIPMDARFLINDGQHRRAAIERALEDAPQLKSETISIVIYVDLGLKRSQQLFADLNRYAVRPTQSLSILYDHRDPLSRMAYRVICEVKVFSGMTETAKSTISNRSRKLFTLSGIYQATCKLLCKTKGDDVSEKETHLAINFWNEVSKHINEWQLAAKGKVTSSELRSDFIHSHSIALQAIAAAGCELIILPQSKWKTKLRNLKKIDWARSKAELWEGRALIGGRVTKVVNNVILTGNVVKNALRMPLTPNEEKVEREYLSGKSQNA